MCNAEVVAVCILISGAGDCTASFVLTELCNRSYNTIRKSRTFPPLKSLCGMVKPPTYRMFLYLSPLFGE